MSNVNLLDELKEMKCPIEKIYHLKPRKNTNTYFDKVKELGFTKILETLKSNNCINSLSEKVRGKIARIAEWNYHIITVKDIKIFLNKINGPSKKRIPISIIMKESIISVIIWGMILGFILLEKQTLTLDNKGKELFFLISFLLIGCGVVSIMGAVRACINYYHMGGIKKGKYIIRNTSPNEYANCVPENILDKFIEAKNRNLFDSYGILTLEKEMIRQPDPILVGQIDGLDDLFVIGDWGDDLRVEDIMNPNKGDK